MGKPTGFMEITRQTSLELPPEERLVAAMQKLGIDFTNLSDVAGHA